MHIVSQKQQEIDQLKHRLFQLERLQLAEKHAEDMANQLIGVLQEENTQLQATICQLQAKKQETNQLYALKDQFQKLRRKNVELEQVRSNLSSEIFNMRNQFTRANFHFNQDLERTNWAESVGASRSDSEMGRSYMSSSFVAPSLVDSRYSSMAVEAQEETAEPKPEIRYHMLASGWNKENRCM